VVLTTAVVAYAVPDFGEYLSLLGSSLCTILGFLLPTYFHLQVFGKELGKGEFSLNVTLFVGGALFAVVGTASSLRNMMAPG
jgi:proton-coupled amino acid transporter